jgi:hypothetical protein
MSEFTTLREAVDTLAGRSSSPDFGELKRRATRRGRRRVVIVVTATAALIAGPLLAISGLDDDRPAPPVKQPEPVIRAVPVWYDAKGLHRGEVVEQTAVKLGVLGDSPDTLTGALALVRSGAVYLDPTTGDVWFHPWGGDPRIVGHDSEAGPGGDPNGDTAAWFEGSDALNAGPGELVVYDTAAGREVSRSSQRHGVTGSSGDHYPPGNTFLQVSAERVVWAALAEVYGHDVRTRTTTAISAMPEDLRLVDLHDDVQLIDSRGSLTVRAPGRAEKRYSRLESHVRLSPSGRYALAVESTDDRHGAAIVDTGTGDLWRVPKNVYPWIAWSYGDIAMVDLTEDELLACDPASQTCKNLPAESPILMPTN